MTAPTGGEPQAGQPTTPPAPPPAPGAPTNQPPADPWASYQWDGNVDSLPADVAKVIRDARADAAKNRTDPKVAAQQARDTVVQDIAKALGIGTSDEPLDPAKLTEQLGQTRQQWEAAEDHAASLAVENDVIRAAVRLGADPDKLLDSQRFCQEVDNLDFTDEADFRTKLDAKIKAAVEKDPTLRLAGQAPARVGADLTGGPGGTGARPASLGAAVAEAYRQR